MEKTERKESLEGEKKKNNIGERKKSYGTKKQILKTSIDNKEDKKVKNTRRKSKSDGINIKNEEKVINKEIIQNDKDKDIFEISKRIV